MTDGFEQDLARGLARLAEGGVPQAAPPPIVDDSAPTPPTGDNEAPAVAAPSASDPRTTTRWWQAAAALVLLAGLAGALVIQSESQVANRSFGVADEWRILAPAPIQPREHHTAVWTGAEMIVWGGETVGPADCDDAESASCSRTAEPAEAGQAPENQLADGAAYDPTTDTWRVLPPAPIQPRSHHAAVWTGTEMIIWGGSNGYRPDQLGAAYDPVNDAWRVLPETGAAQIFDPVLLWDGNTLHAFAPLQDDNQGVHHLRYDPAADAWSEPTPIGLTLAETGLVTDDGTLHVAGRQDNLARRVGVQSTNGSDWAESGFAEVDASGPRLMVQGDRSPAEVVRVEEVQNGGGKRGVTITGVISSGGGTSFMLYGFEGDKPRVPRTTDDTITDNFFAIRMHDGRVITTDRFGEASVGAIGGRWVDLPELALSSFAASHVWTGEELIIWGGRGRDTDDASIADGAAIAIRPVASGELD